MEQDILGSYMQRAKIEQDIIPVLVNTAGRRDLVEHVVSHEFLDLSMIYAVIPEKRMEVDGEFSVITPYMAKQLRFSNEDLYSLAERNMKRRMPVGCFSLETWLEYRLREIGAYTGPSQEGRSLGRFSPPIYLLKNEKNCFGATVLVYQDPIRDLADRLGENLFLLPSSIHEVIAVPESMECSAEELAQIVRQVNREMVGPQDYLSDHVYYYDRDQRHLTLAQEEAQKEIEPEDRFRDNTRRKKGR